MRLLVCGTRTYSDEFFMFARLDELHSKHNITVVIEGEAKGADKMARKWAEQNNIPVSRFPARWGKFGRAAGPIRNKQMLTEGQPDMVAAFIDKPLGQTIGTLNMINQASKAKIDWSWYSSLLKESEGAGWSDER